jgi:hypothetical protein
MGEVSLSGGNETSDDKEGKAMLLNGRKEWLFNWMSKSILIIALCVFAQAADAQEKGLPQKRDLNEAASLLVAETIRTKSAGGELTYPEELLMALSGIGISKPDMDLSAVSRKFPDVTEAFTATGRRCYYSSRAMSEPYARVLLARDAPILLVVDFVRECSLRYTRPVSLALFAERPFGLSVGDVLKGIDEMKRQGQFTDICQTESSLGTVFLYSTWHLDSEYAATLAEWYDVGQRQNP